jgi:ribosomal protein L11 methyltransferase
VHEERQHDAAGAIAPAVLLRAHAPFDLIVANILASPLTRLAPSIARALIPGGLAILSGLLRNQENVVLGFYRALGLTLRQTLRDGPWSALVLARAGR